MSKPVAEVKPRIGQRIKLLASGTVVSRQATFPVKGAKAELGTTGGNGIVNPHTTVTVVSADGQVIVSTFVSARRLIKQASKLVAAINAMAGS